MEIENITLQIDNMNISNDNIENVLIDKFDNISITNNTNNTNNIKLSNMYYSKDEIEITFITCLLKYEETENELINQENMKEILFWINEYFKTNFETACINECINNSTFYLLFKVYYDFYSVLNPKFYKYIYSKYKICKHANFNYEICYKYINDIVYNMAILYSEPDVFIMRQFYNNHKHIDNFTIKKLYRKTKNNYWLDCYDKTYHNLLLSINKNDIYNITYYLLFYLNNDVYYNKKNVRLYDSLYYTLINYFTNLSNMEVINLKNIEEKWLLQKEIFENVYNNIFHFYLNLIMFMKTDEIYINLLKIYYETEDYYNNFIYDIFINIEHIKPYNLLKQKRIYEINDLCSCFILDRNNYNYEYYRNIILTNYLYFTKNNSYNEVVDLDLDLHLDNMDINDAYNYELDEQPLNIQNKSLKYIDNNTDYDLEYWINNVFIDSDYEIYKKPNNYFNILFKINY